MIQLNRTDEAYCFGAFTVGFRLMNHVAGTAPRWDTKESILAIDDELETPRQGLTW